jgi:hypothetical protein
VFSDTILDSLAAFFIEEEEEEEEEEFEDSWIALACAWTELICTLSAIKENISNTEQTVIPCDDREKM